MNIFILAGFSITLAGLQDLFLLWTEVENLDWRSKASMQPQSGETHIIRLPSWSVFNKILWKELCERNSHLQIDNLQVREIRPQLQLQGKMNQQILVRRARKLPVIYNASQNETDVLNIFLLNVEKMAIILPTGQWYAPSAVTNDAWYCIVLHCIAWYCMILHGIAC